MSDDPIIEKVKRGVSYPLYLIGGFLFAVAVMATLALLIMFVVGFD